MQLTRSLHRANGLHPDKPALREDGRAWTYAQLTQWAARKAAVLQGLGTRRGDRVALLAHSDADCVSWLFACWWLGAVAVPLNIRWSAAELSYALGDLQATLLLVDDALTGRMQSVTVPAATRTPAARTLAEHAAAAAPLADTRAGGDTLAAILYTGGTTGFPKGAMLTHANLWSAAVLRLTAVPTAPDSCVLLAAPLFHVAGLGRLLGQMTAGATVLLQRGFQPKAVLRAMQDEGVTEALLVPSMIQMLLDEADFSTYRLDGVQRIIWGASPIAPALLQRALAGFARSEFVHAYGMTETSAMAAINAEVRQGGARAESVGRPVTGVEARILASDGSEAPRGDVGELALRGPMVAAGYWNRPGETEAAFVDGWLRTGDAARLDADGYLYVVDRLKDMIITGGENVYGTEVEGVLARHAGVARCAVIGVAHARWGEAVHAVVVPRPEAQPLQADELDAHCRGLLAGFKCPKTYEFRADLPMSAAGKVLKSVLRQGRAGQAAAAAEEKQA